MVTKWTPGEWTPWKTPDGGWAVRAEWRGSRNRRYTAYPALVPISEFDEANAHLLAAGKALYEALEDLLSGVCAGPVEGETGGACWCGCETEEECEGYQARAALARARGEEG